MSTSSDMRYLLSFNRNIRQLVPSLTGYFVRKTAKLSLIYPQSRPISTFLIFSFLRVFFVQLTPSDFVQMTAELYGENPQPQRTIQEKIVKEAVHINQRAKAPPKNSQSAVNQKDLVTRKKGNKTIETSDMLAIRLKEEKEQEELAAAAVLAEKAIIEKQAEHEIARFQRDTYVTRPVWRMAIFGASGTKGFGMNPEEEKVERERLEKKRLRKEARREQIRLDEKFFNDEDMEDEI